MSQSPVGYSCMTKGVIARHLEADYMFFFSIIGPSILLLYRIKRNSGWYGYSRRESGS